MMKNKLIISGMLGLAIGFGVLASTTITVNATIKSQLLNYEKDSKAIEHIESFLNSPIADINNPHYNEKAVNHMKLIKAYIKATNIEEKASLMAKIDEVEKEQNNEKVFWDFFKENKYLTEGLQDKTKELGREGKKDEACLYINKRMDLIKELYQNKDKYKNPKLAGEGLNSYWVYDGLLNLAK